MADHGTQLRVCADSICRIVQEEEAPSGMLLRGHYNAISSFVDDDKKKHLEFEWSFDIAKDW
jgi:Rho GDP-dissociation inhibitor